VNASGWNEYIISVTNPNDKDIHKTLYLEGTRYNWDDTGCWVRDSDFDGKTVASLENMTVHSGDTVQVTVPVQLKATGERNFYISKVRGEEGIKKGKIVIDPVLEKRGIVPMLKDFVFRRFIMSLIHI